jgi:hypothetical protein
MSNNFSNPRKVTQSEQRRPIAKLKFDLGETKPRNPNQPSSDNKPSQEQK